MHTYTDLLLIILYKSIRSKLNILTSRLSHRNLRE